jgi:hypothetical protein
MSKFNRPGAAAAAVGARRAAATSPVTTTTTTTATHEGAPGYVRDPKSELFLLAVSNMVGENTFYEAAGDRDERYRALIAQVAVTDGPWLAEFLPWLRGEANMRSAPLVGALEAVHARRAADVQDGISNRQLVDAVLQRPDEPGEAVAYWTSRYGRNLPQPVKRGIAKAVRRLYNERSLLKYDTESKAVRFADVLELSHPRPSQDWQRALFTHAIDRRHGNQDRADPPAWRGLPTVSANRQVRERVAAGESDLLLQPDALRNAGMTWEDALSLAGPNVDKAKLWTALIPSMGYMSLIRNLRNFDEAGIPDDVAAGAAARLADPAQVARSRQFPFRFLSAYENAPSLRWGHALNIALGHSLANIPALPGRSLILIDTSASMQQPMSDRSTMTPGKAAAVFGVALAAKGELVDLHGFADGVFRHDVPKGAAVIREVDRFLARTGEVGHGTAIAMSLQATFAGHDRVFIMSDMQTMADQSTYYSSGTRWTWQAGMYRPTPRTVDQVIPAGVPIYGFNLGGYRPAAMKTGSGNRHEFGGLTDATFRMVPLLEAGRNAAWPWAA